MHRCKPLVLTPSHCSDSVFKKEKSKQYLSKTVWGSPVVCTYMLICTVTWTCMQGNIHVQRQKEKYSGSPSGIYMVAHNYPAIFWPPKVWICIYMYLCMCVCVYIHMYMYIYVSMYVCIYTYVYVYMYLCMCMYIHMYICIYVCVYICIYVCIYICIYLSMCVYIHMYICIYKQNIHTH